MQKRNRCDLLRSECGASLVELAMLMPVFVLLMAVAVDLGRASYLVQEIQGAALAAVAYGAQNPTDLTGMSNAAKDDAPNVPNLSVGSPTYGCECATDTTGSTYSANCAVTPSCASSNVVYRVKVTVTAPYTTLFPWPRIPSSMSFSSSASMRSAGS
jgi:Flp pilus assembly protein TadG